MELTQSQIHHIKSTCSLCGMTETQTSEVITLCNMTYVEGKSAGILAMFSETRRNMTEVFTPTEKVPF